MRQDEWFARLLERCYCALALVATGPDKLFFESELRHFMKLLFEFHICEKKLLLISLTSIFTTHSGGISVVVRVRAVVALPCIPFSPAGGKVSREAETVNANSKCTIKPPWINDDGTGSPAFDAFCHLPRFLLYSWMFHLFVGNSIGTAIRRRHTNEQLIVAIHINTAHFVSSLGTATN